jgi:hypothetical protein
MSDYTPALAASTVAMPNNSGLPLVVTIAGGTLTSINVPAGGTQVGTTGPGQYTVPSGSSIALTYSVAPTTFVWSDSTPAMPASTVPVTNTTGQDQDVQIAGGTVTNVSVNGVTAAAGSNVTVRVPAGGSIAITYSVAPAWAWVSPPDFQEQPGYAQENTGLPDNLIGQDPMHPEAGEPGLGTGVSN